jgi:hypothetical protein
VLFVSLRIPLPLHNANARSIKLSSVILTACSYPLWHTSHFRLHLCPNCTQHPPTHTCIHAHTHTYIFTHKHYMIKTRHTHSHSHTHTYIYTMKTRHKHSHSHTYIYTMKTRHTQVPSWQGHRPRWWGRSKTQNGDHQQARGPGWGGQKGGYVLGWGKPLVLQMRMLVRSDQLRDSRVSCSGGHAQGMSQCKPSNMLKHVFQSDETCLPIWWNMPSNMMKHAFRYDETCLPIWWNMPEGRNLRRYQKGYDRVGIMECLLICRMRS